MRIAGELAPADTAILAKTLGIPAVVSCPGALSIAEEVVVRTLDAGADKPLAFAA